MKVKQKLLTELTNYAIERVNDIYHLNDEDTENLYRAFYINAAICVELGYYRIAHKDIIWKGLFSLLNDNIKSKIDKEESYDYNSFTYWIRVNQQKIIRRSAESILF